MRRRRPNATFLQRLFLSLVVTTALMVTLTEVFDKGRRRLHDVPRYTLQKTYVAAVCSDKRLGNAMFIYAAVVGVGKQLNVSKMIERRCAVTDVFDVSADVVDDYRRWLPSHVVFEEYGRRASAYDIKVKKLARRHTLLSGYFQSWMYFADASDDVAREYRFAEATRRMADDFLSENVPEAWREQRFVRVGVHVRRGDLLQEYYKNYGYTTADREYFVKAMQYFRRRYSRVQFVVCSDDIGWAKDNVIGDHVLYSEGHKDYEDLAILSHCDHVIISVGSFGWWAAWLANGTTIYYDNWPKEYSKLEYHVNKKTYFPPEWIPMR